ncbi:C2 domain-containing protein [Gloeopeniophorella convolvens]|nr:C2 domain-containing protein [Gloeopeniophorella convolvens]
MTTTARNIGTLIVVILKARNLPNKRQFGKQDPYCSVALNGETRKTKIIKRGGQHPEWDEEVRFNIYEDPDALSSSGGGTPPPLPPKGGRGPKKILGGERMAVACFAADKDPDLIGEATVDLTEVLTKGETDEWFTLTNKDKYSGEVYLELTFWSNEPRPEKKSTPRLVKANKQYGGPGTFVPSDDSPNHLQQGSGSFHEEYRRESLPSAFLPSNSSTGLDLYKPEYEHTVKARAPRSSSVDQVVNDMGD